MELKILTYGRGLDDRASFDDFFLVHLRAGSVEITNNGRHASFVAHGSREVNGLLRVILGEAILHVSWHSKVQWNMTHTSSPFLCFYLPFFATQS